MLLIEWIQNNSKINSEISSEVDFFYLNRIKYFDVQNIFNFYKSIFHGVFRSFFTNFVKTYLTV